MASIQKYHEKPILLNFFPNFIYANKQLHGPNVMFVLLENLLHENKKVLVVKCYQSKAAEL